MEGEPWFGILATQGRVWRLLSVDCRQRSSKLTRWSPFHDNLHLPQLKKTFQFECFNLNFFIEILYIVYKVHCVHTLWILRRVRASFQIWGHRVSFSCFWKLGARKFALAVDRDVLLSVPMTCVCVCGGENHRDHDVRGKVGRRGWNVCRLCVWATEAKNAQMHVYLCTSSKLSCRVRCLDETCTSVCMWTDLKH